MASAKDDMIKRFLTDKIIEAAQKGNMSIVSDCLKKGANIDTTTSAGTPLTLLAMQNYSSRPLAAWLIEQGANPNAASANGKSLLMQAVENRDTALLDALLNKKADVNHAANDGSTALMLAVTGHDSLETVKKLVTAGADIFAVNKKGKGVLDMVRAIQPSYGDSDTQRSKDALEKYFLSQLPDATAERGPLQPPPVPEMKKKPFTPAPNGANKTPGQSPTGGA